MSYHEVLEIFLFFIDKLLNIMVDSGLFFVLAEIIEEASVENNYFKGKHYTVCSSQILVNWIISFIKKLVLQLDTTKYYPTFLHKKSVLHYLVYFISYENIFFDFMKEIVTVKYAFHKKTYTKPLLTLKPPDLLLRFGLSENAKIL